MTVLVLSALAWCWEKAQGVITALRSASTSSGTSKDPKVQAGMREIKMAPEDRLDELIHKLKEMTAQARKLVKEAKLLNRGRLP